VEGTTAVGTQYVYDFSEGSADMRELLGGKGANVAEMTRILGPERVPAGFTITTEACVQYMRDGAEPEELDAQVDEALARLEERAGKRLGDPEDPLLVSVRSGARESMPGMLDTVLNLGLNNDSVQGLAGATGNERFAWDSYRRFAGSPRYCLKIARPCVFPPRWKRRWLIWSATTPEARCAWPSARS